jgi:hypothetical protein
MPVQTASELAAYRGLAGCGQAKASIAFETLIWLLLGWVFLPWTTLMYLIAFPLVGFSGNCCGHRRRTVHHRAMLQWRAGEDRQASFNVDGPGANTFHLTLTNATREKIREGITRLGRVLPDERRVGRGYGAA